MKLIQTAVENKRNQMMQTAQKTGLTSNETLKLSRELDEIMNVFVPPSFKNQSSPSFMKQR